MSLSQARDRPQVGVEKRREHDSYVMVVNGDATEYREVLAKARQVLQENGEEDLSSGNKSTRKSKVLITLNKGNTIR